MDVIVTRGAFNFLFTGGKAAQCNPRIMCRTVHKHFGIQHKRLESSPAFDRLSTAFNQGCHLASALVAADTCVEPGTHTHVVPSNRKAVRDFAGQLEVTYACPNGRAQRFGEARIKVAFIFRQPRLR
jgi:hypothetical protein